MSKIIVLTGANGGIGAAMLRALAAQGHQIVGLDKDADNIDVSIETRFLLL